MQAAAAWAARLAWGALLPHCGGAGQQSGGPCTGLCSQAPQRPPQPLCVSYLSRLTVRAQLSVCHVGCSIKHPGHCVARPTSHHHASPCHNPVTASYKEWHRAHHTYPGPHAALYLPPSDPEEPPRCCHNVTESHPAAAHLAHKAGDGRAAPLAAARGHQQRPRLLVVTVHVHLGAHLGQHARLRAARRAHVAAWARRPRRAHLPANTPCCHNCTGTRHRCAQADT
mmetsp:Transcript_16526/g.41252  ORF Transcript_16526/g.41252 Transcript_16526/m.41252 type:complete len:226 (-) Transcript_16526:8-685(-)